MAAGKIPPGTALTHGLLTKNSSEEMSQHRPQLTGVPKAYLPYQTGDPLPDHLQEHKVSLQPDGHRTLLRSTSMRQRQPLTSPHGLRWKHEPATKESKLLSKTATPVKTINDQGTVIQFMTMLMTKTRAQIQPRLDHQLQATNLLSTEQSLRQT